MSYTLEHRQGSPAALPPVTGPAAGGLAIDLVIAVARALIRRYRNWQDCERLRGCPDYMLRDMGISRFEIDRIVTEGPDDPARRRLSRRL